MNVLADKCPERFEFSGHSLRINNDFLTCYKILCKIEEETKNDRISDEGLLYALKNFFKDEPTPENVKVAYEKMIEFLYATEKIEKNDEKNKKEEKKEKKEKVFSYSQDSDYIFSAFFQVYGINLIKNNINWWEFNSLFNGLPSGQTKLSQVIEVRSAEMPTGSANAERRIKLSELKELFALKEFHDQKKERISKMFDSLFK